MSNPELAVKLYGITNCDTVKKARAWLIDAGVDHQLHNFKTQGVPEQRLQAWTEAVGWEKLVNRQGNTWRRLDPAIQAGVTDAASAQALMCAEASVIKRPVVEWPGSEVTVGFDTAVWSAKVAQMR